MQYYTKQQLQGAGRYSGSCRIGNWNEDDFNDEHLLKDYLYKKDRGEMKLDLLRSRMEIANKPAPLSVIKNDGFVHFGDVLQLTSCLTKAKVAIDTEDIDPRPGEHACAVSVSPVAAPIARNTFLLTKYCPPGKTAVYEGGYNDEVVHYGQKLYIISNPQAFGLPLDVKGGPDPWYLRSVPQSNNHFSRLSRHQEISVTPRSSYETVWKVVDPDPRVQAKVEGQPVKSGTPVLIENCNTAKCLNCEERKYWNDFGEEYEISAHITTRFHRAQVLENMGTGMPEAMTVKPKSECNQWLITCGTKELTLPSSESVTFDMKKIMRKLLTQLSKMGANGFEALKKSFKEFDTDGSNFLCIEEFHRALQFCAIALNEQEVQKLMDFFDEDKSGGIRLEEFFEKLSQIDNMQ